MMTVATMDLQDARLFRIRNRRLWRSTIPSGMPHCRSSAATQSGSFANPQEQAGSPDLSLLAQYAQRPQFGHAAALASRTADSQPGQLIKPIFHTN